MPTEDIIWDAITNSAKTKFDYASFEANFPFSPDMLLFSIIVGLATGRNKEEMSFELYNQVLAVGFSIDQTEILDFINRHESTFGMEVLAARIAGDMLSQGTDPMAVYISISQLIKLKLMA